MPSQCIADLDSKKSRPIVRIRILVCCTWNCDCDLLERNSYEESRPADFRYSLRPFRIRCRQQDCLLQKRRRNRAGNPLHASGQGTVPRAHRVHEYWGLNDWVKDQALKLTAQGYVTLAVDLYRAKVATTPDMAHE